MSVVCLSRDWELRALSAPGERRYHAYPHCNGFADAGRSIVLGEFDERFSSVSLWKVDLSGKGQQRICTFPIHAPPANPSTAQVWFDVALQANVMAVIVDDAVWTFDLAAMNGGKIVYRAAEGEIFNPLPSLREDGARLLVPYTRGEFRGVREVDLGSGQVKRLFEMPWCANHFHYSPHSPDWIAFCHEGDARVIRDRMWAWHPTLVPQGHCIFQQNLDGGRSLMVGHERACFHRPSILTVAFGAEGVPCGLYELDLDAGKSRLVSPGNRDWHCDVSRDGRSAVVDTTGPHDREGYGWENQGGGNRSDILLVYMKTGRREPLATSHQAIHPWHPHPAFSPDGRRIVFGEFSGSKENPGGSVWMLESRG
jgi:hypothetical protein